MTTKTSKITSLENLYVYSNSNMLSTYICLLQAIAKRMEQHLNIHDRLDPSVKHQGMVLTQTKVGINPAETFCDIYNELYPNKCAVYVSETRKDILDAFVDGRIRTLVIIGRLLEGFDHKPVSVLGIVRNIAPTSRVLFAQFVGRAVRKNHPNDPVPAQIVTHPSFNQRPNYETFEELAEEEPTDVYN